MKLKFKHKVFLTILLNSLAILVCTLVIARYYAFRNFEEYIGKVEMERLDEPAKSLGREYEKTGNWNFVLEDPARLRDAGPFGPGRFPGVSGPGDRHPPHPPPLPPPHAGGHRETGPPPHGPPRLALFDADKRPLTPEGTASLEDYRLKPIEVDGRTVGWLGLKRPEGLTHPLDVEFLRVHSQTLYTIGAVTLLLAVLVTFALSRHLLGPVKALAEGARALTSRRFETRIEVRSQDELGRLAADFNDMARALERHEQMRRQWVADISHELRTPLAILRGEIEAMQDGVREITREALDSLHLEVLRVGRIVQDLHDLSLIESRVFDTEPAALRPLEVLQGTLKSFQTRFEQRGIRIATDMADSAGVSIMADADRLNQLFSNLLENTLRYAQTPGELKISQDIVSGLLCIRFEDSGPGVPEDSLDRLFDRLYRVDKARSRAQGGSGLGLAICRSVAESFGGRIEASNAPSGGLRISVFFPVVNG